MNDIYQDNLLQERQGASPALTPSGCAQADVPKGTKRNPACRGEKTRGRRGRLSAHSVFVIGKLCMSNEEAIAFYLIVLNGCNSKLDTFLGQGQWEEKPNEKHK